MTIDPFLLKTEISHSTRINKPPSFLIDKDISLLQQIILTNTQQPPGRRVRTEFSKTECAKCISEILNFPLAADLVRRLCESGNES